MLQAALSPRAADLHVVLVQKEEPIISRDASGKQVEEFLGGLLAQKEVFALDRRLAEVQGALKRAGDEEKDALMQEKMVLSQRRRQLNNKKFKVF